MFTSWKNQGVQVDFIIKNIKWVMLVSGVLTFTMFYGLFAPQAALESMFGASFSGTLELIVVRSWCALVGLMGAILIYGALDDKSRVFSISVATASKVIFVSLVIFYGQEFLGEVGLAIALDCITIALAVLFLVALRVKRSTA
jgi:hypothetical protein